MWTEEKTANLITLWQQGLTGTQVAQALNATTSNSTPNITRNAVLGKIDRLGIKRKTPNKRPAITLAKPSKPATIKDIGVRAIGIGYHKGRKHIPKNPPKPSQPYTPEKHETRKTSISFKELAPDTCRFPVGDKNKLEQLFCGRKPKHNSPYCTTHHSTCHKPNKTWAELSEERKRRGPGRPRRAAA